MNEENETHMGNIARAGAHRGTGGPGFAAEGVYSITITNDKAGHTYEAYQIFAGTVASDAEQEGNRDRPHARQHHLGYGRERRRAPCRAEGC